MSDDDPFEVSPSQPLRGQDALIRRGAARLAAEGGPEKPAEPKGRARIKTENEKAPAKQPAPAPSEGAQVIELGSRKRREGAPERTVVTPVEVLSVPEPDESAPAETWNGLDLGALSDEDIVDLAGALVDEQRRRALALADPEAIIEECYRIGFSDRGAAKQPYLRSGMLVCPGSLVSRSHTSHECTFAHIGEDWVWESGELVLDDVRKTTINGKEAQRSVSLVAAYEGLAVDMITSKLGMGGHTMKSANSWVVEGGKLVLVKTRTPKAIPTDSH